MSFSNTPRICPEYRDYFVFHLNHLEHFFNLTATEGNMNRRFKSGKTKQNKKKLIYYKQLLLREKNRSICLYH